MNDWLPARLHSAAKERALKTGEYLFHLGDRTAGLYQVMRGQVRLVRIAPNGQEVTLHVAGAGETIAEASLFASVYHCDAVALTDARVRLYPKSLMLAEFQRNPKAAQAFMAMLARQVMALRTRLEQRNIRSARDRIRHYLALNAGPDGRTVELRATMKELASVLGLTHEALYRALAAMAAAGEIERTRKSIRLKARRAI
jgi:CRP-like cAMP-binding protein